jgi:hypothetical protein
VSVCAKREPLTLSHPAREVGVLKRHGVVKVNFCCQSYLPRSVPILDPNPSAALSNFYFHRISLQMITVR